MHLVAGWPNLYLLMPACFLAGLVSGMAGFAFGAIAMALMLPLGPASVLVPVTLTGSVISQVMALPMLRRGIIWQRLWPFLLPGLIGVPIGTAALILADPRGFRISLGIVLVLFAVYGLYRGPSRPVQTRGPWGDAAVGLIGGAMGGYAGLSGIVPTIWCGMRGWTRDEQRAVYQPFILIIQIAALAAGGAAHVFSASTLLLATACATAVLAGALCGFAVYRRLDERRFRQAVLLLLLVSGVVQLV